MQHKIYKQLHRHEELVQNDQQRELGQDHRSNLLHCAQQIEGNVRKNR